MAVRNLQEIVKHDSVSLQEARNIQKQEFLNLRKQTKSTSTGFKRPDNTALPEMVRDSSGRFVKSGPVNPTNISVEQKERDKVGRFVKGNPFAFRKFIDQNLPKPQDNPTNINQPSSTKKVGQDLAEASSGSTPETIPQNSIPVKSLRKNRINKVSNDVGLNNASVVKNMLTNNKGLSQLLQANHVDTELLTKIAEASKQSEVSAGEIEKYTALNTKLLETLHSYIKQQPIRDKKNQSKKSGVGQPGESNSTADLIESVFSGNLKSHLIDKLSSKVGPTLGNMIGNATLSQSPQTNNLNNVSNDTDTTPLTKIEKYTALNTKLLETLDSDFKQQPIRDKKNQHRKDDRRIRRRELAGESGGRRRNRKFTGHSHADLIESVFSGNLKSHLKGRLVDKLSSKLGPTLGSMIADVGENIGKSLIEFAPEIGMAVGAAFVGYTAVKGIMGTGTAKTAPAQMAKLGEKKLHGQQNAAAQPTNIPSIFKTDPSLLKKFESWKSPEDREKFLLSYGVGKADAKKFAQMPNSKFEKALQQPINPFSKTKIPPPPPPRQIISSNGTGLSRYETETPGHATPLAMSSISPITSVGATPLPTGSIAPTIPRSSATRLPGGTSAGAADVKPFIYDKNISPNAKALLDTISAGESAGDYHIREGGGHFSGNHFPQGFGKGGISSASGKYQFTKATWEEAKKALHLKDFSPANQDKAAWWLAQQRYHTTSGGRNLATDLKSKDPKRQLAIAHALSGTWTSLPGGHDALQTGGRKNSKYLAQLTGNMQKYHSPQYAQAMNHIVMHPSVTGKQVAQLHEQNVALAAHTPSPTLPPVVPASQVTNTPPLGGPSSVVHAHPHVRSDDPVFLDALRQDMQYAMS